MYTKTKCTRVYAREEGKKRGESIIFTTVLCCERVNRVISILAGVKIRTFFVKPFFAPTSRKKDQNSVRSLTQ